MSDDVLNIISGNPVWVPSAELADRALLVYRRYVPTADEAKAEFLDGIRFVG